MRLKRSTRRQAMSNADLASLRIAEDRVEWAVRAHDQIFPMDTPDDALRLARKFDRDPKDPGPHRVVSHRVIVTEWADADE